MLAPLKRWATLTIVVNLLVTLPFTLSAASERASTTAAKQVPVYKPPKRGAPSSRVGGGTRSTAAGFRVFTVLAPEHTGWTAHDQPTLYWYISAPADMAVELTLIDEVSVKPLLETTLRSPEQAGIHSVRIADYGVHLQPRVEYQWSVALVSDRKQRSNDIITSGTLAYVEPSAELKRTLEHADPESRAFVYAEAGIWYDALDSLSRLIAAQPEDRQLREQRASLLEQVGLPEVAEHDRR